MANGGTDETLVHEMSIWERLIKRHRQWGA